MRLRPQNIHVMYIVTFFFAPFSLPSINSKGNVMYGFLIA